MPDQLTAINTEDAILPDCLIQAGAVEKLFGHGGEIATIHRKRTNLATSYEIDLLTVELTSGERRHVFLKNYGISIRGKDQRERRIDREVRVYRELLAGADLDTPQYCGSVLAPARGQTLLLLEYILGTMVDHEADLRYWIEAPRWIGRLHAHFARQCERLERCDYLLRHDENHFMNVLSTARHAVAQLTPELSDRFEQVARRYQPIAREMGRPFPSYTLVHGAFRSNNVMVCDRNEPIRFVGYDWEEAAVGSPLYDLAYFADGFEPPVLGQMFEMYRRGAGAEYSATLDDRTMRRLFDCFRVHVITNTLASAIVRRYTREDVIKLVAMLEDRFAAL